MIVPKRSTRSSAVHSALRKARGSTPLAIGLVFGSTILGLLLLAHATWPPDWLNYLGLVLLSLFAAVLTRFHLRHTPVGRNSAQTAERIVWLTAFLSIAGVQLMTRSLGSRELSGLGFLLTAPLVAQAMLVSALLGPAVSLFALTLVVLLLGVSRCLPVELLTVAWLAGAVGAHAVNPLKQRSDLVRAMSVQTLVQAGIASCVTAGVVSTAPPVLEAAGWAALAAIVATSIFWLAVTVLERLFGIISDWSLLELCSPEHPLIRDLCLRAPGTYAHSVMVGNLAESAAREVGANPVLCRAMAYYHDVGKMLRPAYFIENQIGANIHEELSPTLSALVVAAHVKDGLELARRHRLPKVLLDGIVEHHGTSLIAYFYRRAIERDLGSSAELEQFFRYDGPKPQTKEAAILMLADSVEAISRTARTNGEELEVLVLRTIEERRADGQLDECDLTMRDLTSIKDAFLRALCAIRHERIEYGPAGVATAAIHGFDLERIQLPGISAADTEGR